MWLTASAAAIWSAWRRKKNPGSQIYIIDYVILGWLLYYDYNIYILSPVHIKNPNMNPGMYWICSLAGCLVVFHMIGGWDYWLSSFSGTQYLTVTKVWVLGSSSKDSPLMHGPFKKKGLCWKRKNLQVYKDASCLLRQWCFWRFLKLCQTIQ